MINVVNLQNQVLGEVELNEQIFKLDYRPDILNAVINWQNAKRATQAKATKQVGDVSGTTAKPYRQKGTGRARQGSLRSTQFRGGGITFGPSGLIGKYSLNKKVRKLGVKVALSVKYAQDQLIILEDINLDSNKTSQLRDTTKAFDCKSLLVIHQQGDEQFKSACRNLYHLNLLPLIGINVISIMKHEKVAITRSALNNLEERLS